MKKILNERQIQIKHWQLTSAMLMLYDIFSVTAAYFLALWFRFDCSYSAIDPVYLARWMAFAPIYGLLCLVVFFILRLYNSIWRFASYMELMRCIQGCVITSLIHIAFITAVMGRMPVSYYIVGSLIQFFAIIGIRFSYRFVLLLRGRRNTSADEGPNVMIIGAGAAGQMILREVLESRRAEGHAVCLIDDNPNKWGRYVEGVPVVGGRDSILACVDEYGIRKILVAIPSAKAEDMRDILNICKESGCEVKKLPGVYQLVNGIARLSNLQEVRIEDLLGREPITVDNREIYQMLTGKVILVTGAGGSIGSELCRHIASHSPKQLILFDVYENSAHAIMRELRYKHPDVDLQVLIGSVRDSYRLNFVFDKYRPEVVFHAAAHKHVPLMEYSPCEAIKNNTIGTYKTAYAAMRYGCKRFVLISTDKAVNPVNVMGASKRLCEMVVQSFDKLIRAGQADWIPELTLHGESYEGHLDKHPQTEFVAVRFGNVLGSNGSVIPTFKDQIAHGGPVTVTHPDVIRYFMTIPEAVSLVLQAAAYAKGGEIFVLDMGEPMKIDTLARNLILLSGLRPGQDIEIAYTGLRPGEKLYEEKLMGEEGLTTTPNKLIYIAKPLAFDPRKFLLQMRMLMNAAYGEREDEIRELVEQVVDTYKPDHRPQLHVMEGKGRNDRRRREPVRVGE